MKSIEKYSLQHLCGRARERERGGEREDAGQQGRAAAPGVSRAASLVRTRECNSACDPRKRQPLMRQTQSATHARSITCRLLLLSLFPNCCSFPSHSVAHHPVSVCLLFIYAADRCDCSHCLDSSSGSPASKPAKRSRKQFLRLQSRDRGCDGMLLFSL